MIKNPPAMQETQIRSLTGLGRSPGEGNGDPLQEPGGLQSMCLRAGHEFATKQQFFVSSSKPHKNAVQQLYFSNFKDLSFAQSKI